MIITKIDVNLWLQHLKNKANLKIVHNDNCDANAVEFLISYWKTVAENISNEFQNAKIFSISVSKSATKNAKFNKAKNQINSLLSTLFEIENSLYETSILIETENTNFKTINTKLITLYDKYFNVFDDLKSSFAEDNSAYNILKKAKTIQTSLLNLTQTDQQEPNSKFVLEHGRNWTQ